MLSVGACAERIVRRPGQFLWRVVRGFRNNQGLLLSGAVAYYMLLSIVPLAALLLVGLYQLYPTDELLTTLNNELQLVMPRGAQALTAHIADFLAHRKLVGWVGIAILLFFSSMAFTVLENAMSVIFHHRVAVRRRHFLVSAVIPFVFIVLIGAGLLLITLIAGAMDSLGDRSLVLFGSEWTLQGVQGVVLYLLGGWRPGAAPDGLVPDHAGRTYCHPACTGGRFRRGPSLGTDPPPPGLVFQHPVSGEHRLRFTRNLGGGAAQLRGGGHHPTLRGPGDRRVRAVQRGTERRPGGIPYLSGDNVVVAVQSGPASPHRCARLCGEPGRAVGDAEELSHDQSSPSQ